MSDSIDSRTVTWDGIEYRVTVEPDHSNWPDEYDCYDDDDKAAWLHNDWSFVGIVVNVVGFSDDQASLWGIEWGKMPRVDHWLDLDHYLANVDPADIMPVLFDEARILAKAARDRLNALPL